MGLGCHLICVSDPFRKRGFRLFAVAEHWNARTLG